MRFFAKAQNDSFLQTFANYLKPPPTLVLGEVGNSLGANWSEGAAFPSAQVFRNDRRGEQCSPVKPTFPIKLIYHSENKRFLSAGVQCTPLQIIL